MSHLPRCFSLSRELLTLALTAYLSAHLVYATLTNLLMRLSFADTLPCYPFTKDDAFILHEDKIPNLLFAGNQV